MLPAIFLFGVTLSIVNLEALGIAAANPVEKAVFLVFGLGYVATRPIILRNLYILIAIMGLTWACALLSTNSGFSWERYVRALVSLVAMLLCFVAMPRRRDQIWLLSAIAFAPLLATGLGFVYAAAGLRGMWGIGDSGADRFQGSIIAASMGAAACAGLFSAVRLADLSSKSYLIVALLNCIPLVLSAARMAVAAAILAAGSAILFGFKKFPRQKILALIYGSAGLLVLLAALGDRIMMRFETSGLNGRDELWAMLYDSLKTHALFGIGLGHQNLLIPLDTARAQRTDAAHNEFLRFAAELGYVGAAVFFALFFAMLFSFLVRKDYGERGILLCVYAAFALFSVTDNAFSVSHIYLLLVAGIVSCKISEPVESRAIVRARLAQASI